MTALANRMLDRYRDMIAVVEKMSALEREEFLAWDAIRPAGVNTSDWPGWERHLIPFEAYAGSAMQTRVKSDSGKQVRLPFRAVWDRDGWTCKRCGAHTNLTVDHIIPRVLGGSNEMDNLQTLCGTCNSSKGARV